MAVPDDHELPTSDALTTSSADLRHLADEHPADIAEAINALTPEEGAQVLAALTPAAAAETLEQMREEDAQEYVDVLPPKAAATALNAMAPDDAVDLLARLPDERRAEILDHLSEESRQDLLALMAYPPETAGGIMSPEVTALAANLTAPEAINRLRQISDESEQIYYTYVVDEQKRLVGVLSLRDLLLAPAAVRLRDIMIQNVVTIPALMDREEVAGLLSKYGYFALPVVDDQQRLLGIVTIDDVVDVIQDEATEDMHRMVGAGADEHIASSVPFVLRRRVPWLLINLGTAFLAATVVGAFEDTLQQVTALAVLMPIVAGQAGNTGLQSMAVMIRSIATGETRGLRLTWMLVREIWIGLGTGVVISAACAVICYIWRQDLMLAAVIGIAMIVCMILSTVAGAFVPWLMRRMGFDPAQSASIILTTITDVTGFGVFLALGSLLLAQAA